MILGYLEKSNFTNQDQGMEVELEMIKNQGYFSSCFLLLSSPGLCQRLAQQTI